tara:strand:+ start:1041 stop:1583 length:543 start_codon:yes stop_codon:yes gene_type:complete
MANVKFSEFTAETTVGNVTEIVGLTAAGNIKITPANLLSGAGANLEKNPSGAVAGNYSSGSTFFSSWASGATVRGKSYYWDGTAWTLANATNSTKSTGIISIAASTDSSLMLREGNIVLDSSSSITTLGAPVYLSTTDGVLTDVEPTGTTGFIVRIVGYVVDVTNKIIYFKPDSSFITLA